MKIRIIRSSLLFLLVCLICISCLKTVDQNEPHLVKHIPNDDSLYGKLYYYFPGGTVSKPVAGATILLDSTIISAVTDSNGIFWLKRVPEGIYSATIHKEHFGDVRLFNIYCPGTGHTNIGNTEMHIFPQFTLSDLHDSINTNDSFPNTSSYVLNGYFRITNPDMAYDMNVLILYSTNPDFGLGNPNNIFSTRYTFGKGVKIHTFSLDMQSLKNYMDGKKLKIHGTTIYMKIYPFPNNSNTPYICDYYEPSGEKKLTSIGDPVSGQFVFP